MSTALWHLHNDVRLAELSAEIWRVAPDTAAACAVAANLASLRGNHELAVASLQRAVSQDPSYAYAHTLLGHELLASADHFGATAAFQRALAIDPRHYNALYGLGTIAMREERFAVAQSYFSRALAAHPSSAVLRCVLAMAQSAQGDFVAALALLETPATSRSRSLASAASASQLAYQRHVALLGLGRLQDARTALETIIADSPTAWPLQVQLAKLCKRLDDAAAATSAMTRALALCPSEKEAAKLKALLHSLQDGDDATGNDTLRL